MENRNQKKSNNKLSLVDQSQTYNMTFNELVGAIFIRSQIIEMLMREMLMKHPDFKIPNNFDRKPFGELLKYLEPLYSLDLNEIKNEGYIMKGTSMYDDLKTACNIRNEAAHGDYLAGISILDLLHNYGTNAQKERFIIDGIRKDLWSIDYCMIDFYNFCSKYN